MSPMWSSSSSEEQSQSTRKRSTPSQQDLIIVVSNTSSSSSSYSSPLCRDNYCQITRTMEDNVWKDKALMTSSFPAEENPYLSLQNPIKTTTLIRPDYYRPTTPFQDYLGRPISQNVPPVPPQLPRPKRKDKRSSNNGSSSSPATALSLNTAYDQFQYIVDTPNSTNNSLFMPNLMPYLPSPTNPIIEGLGSFVGGDCCSSVTTTTTTDSVDRKHKRLIKNRESAARSRARKEAYINELELNLEEMREENRLMKQMEEIRQARQTQPPKESGLQRSSSAPF